MSVRGGGGREWIQKNLIHKKWKEAKTMSNFEKKVHLGELGFDSTAQYCIG